MVATGKLEMVDESDAAAAAVVRGEMPRQPQSRRRTRTQSWPWPWPWPWSRLWT